LEETGVTGVVGDVGTGEREVGCIGPISRSIGEGARAPRPSPRPNLDEEFSRETEIGLGRLPSELVPRKNFSKLALNSDLGEEEEPTERIPEEPVCFRVRGWVLMGRRGPSRDRGLVLDVEVDVG